MTENQTDFYITLNSTSNHTLNIYFPNQICAPRFVLECTTSTTVVQIIFRRQNDGDARRIDES